MSSKKHTFINQQVAFLTKHGKERIVAPFFEQAFDAKIMHTDKFDTDTLGAFDGSIARTLSPVQAALKKAYLSCELTGCNQGLGSEGSFHGLFGIGNMNEEVLAFVDVGHKIEVIASAKQPSPFVPIKANNPEQLLQAIGKFSPDQKWMLKRNEKFIKGLGAEQIIEQVTAWPIHVEPDFRSMNSPKRREVIALACQNLISRLQTLCPKCSAVNFVPDKAITGLACELCTLPTHQVKYWLSKCGQCNYEERVNESNAPASAFHCDYCNP